MGMKTPLPFLLPLALALTQCTWLRPPADPSKVEPLVAQERAEGKEREHQAYENGKADGAADAARGDIKNHKAHSERFTPSTERAYQEGYMEGFGKGGPGLVTAEQQAAHDAGYAAGLKDRRRGRGSDPDQYKGTYNAKLESWFVDGYYEGVEDRN